jgi:hypothetical protein
VFITVYNEWAYFSRRDQSSIASQGKDQDKKTSQQLQGKKPGQDIDKNLQGR